MWKKTIFNLLSRIEENETFLSMKYHIYLENVDVKRWKSTLTCIKGHKLCNTIVWKFSQISRKTKYKFSPTILCNNSEMVQM